eukprot:2196559-Pleurochrysis_carterae.AAC.3
MGCVTFPFDLSFAPSRRPSRCSPLRRWCQAATARPAILRAPSTPAPCICVEYKYLGSKNKE